MNKLILYCVHLSFIFFPLGGKSQIIAGNSFLEGSYIKLGLAPNAAFGTTINAPLGMLPPGADIRNTPVCNLGKIGFVADVGRDGWAVGTPAFIGEYFLPGTPEEGWAVTINGVDYNNNRNFNGMPPPGDNCVGGGWIPGTFTSFQDLPDKQVTNWEGIINGLKIIKRIILPKDKLYFITEIKLVNTTATTLTDIYYMRNVDPDNEVVPAGSGAFVTANKIEYQNPVSANKALVSARGLTYNSYLGLGTIDCRAKVCIGGQGGNPLINRSPRDVYNAAPPRINALGAQNVQDCAIAIAFRVGDIQSLDTVRLAFAYILSIADLEEALSKTAPQFDFNGTTVPSGGGAINCVGSTSSITIMNGEDYNWVWSPATGLNTTIGPSVIYTTQSVPVTYTITGTNAVCNNAMLTLTVYPPTSRVADFIEAAPCGSKTVTFTNQSLALIDPNATYQWDFGDGSPINNIVSPVHIFPDFGIYDVKLTVVTSALACGNDSTYTRRIEVRDKPILVTNYANDACEGSPFTMTGSSSISYGTVSSQQWIFPGGITYSTPSVTHSFPVAGTYDVIFKAISDRSCMDSVIRTIIAESIPTVTFSAFNSCLNKTVSFTNNSTNLVGNITQYDWDFGNGQTSNLHSPTTSYNSFGIKTIRLTASTGNGCSNTSTRTIDIESNPLADFEFSKACPGLPVQFTNRSTNIYGVISTYEWSFAPGQTSALPNPVYTFTAEGNYTVSLKAITTKGCESVVKSVTIPIKTVKAHAGRDTLVFKNSPFQLRGKGGINYLWTPSSFLNAGNIANPVGSLQNDQAFQLEVTDERGCKATDTVSVQVFVEDDIYVPAGFSPNNDGKNDYFRPIAPPGVVYLFEVYNRWGQKLFSTNNPLPGWNGKLQNILQPSGVYVWYLKAKTRSGKEVEKKGTVMLLW